MGVGTLAVTPFSADLQQFCGFYRPGFRGRVCYSYVNLSFRPRTVVE
jgi:hypothetical protein